MEVNKIGTSNQNINEDTSSISDGETPSIKPDTVPSSIKPDIVTETIAKRSTLLEKLVNEKDIFIGNQQRGDPDQSDVDKYDFLDKLLDANPQSFVYRFKRYMTATDLEFLCEINEEDESLSTYVRQINFNVKNRRYEAMRRLHDTDYFKEDNMKERAPVLYNDLIGRHLTYIEMKASASKLDSKLSNILMSHIEQTIDDEQFKQQEQSKESVENAIEESTLTEDEKAAAKDEFYSLMIERFIDGDEPSFDYRTVDTNSEYDISEELNNDLEDQYFS